MDVAFINVSIGYVVGVYSYAYKSTDGGISWNQINIPMAVSMFGIQFINNSTGLIVGGIGIEKTTDSGLSWNNIFDSDGSQLNSIRHSGADLHGQ